MALPVLDGNQSATTLSSVVTGGEHIVAHSVVCLGSTAIANITNAVSGSVVSISNFPSTQTIAGTVTANGDYIGTIDDSSYPARGIAIGFIDASASGNFVAVNNDDPNKHFPVKVGGSLPAISGTVTANDSGALTIVNSSTVTKADVKFTAIAGAYNATDVAQGYTLSPINVDIKGISYVDGQYVNYRNTCVAELVGQGGPAWKAQLIASSVTVSNSVTIGSVPNGSLTTRFGTPTTANTAFATSAVTNASRKYLLIQNVTTGSNVITVGIGFTPTTTQGIQLTAGAGITFESSYIPTGAVQILSSVTASNFTILEA